MSNGQPIRRQGIKFGTSRRLSVEDQIREEFRVIEDNFPEQRVLHLKPDSNEPPTGARVEIVVTKEVLFETTNHVSQDTSKESGGFLLGNRYECPNTKREYIILDQFMKADYTEGTQVSLTFTTDSWAQLKDRLGGKYRGKDLLGWYHSHPGMGIFLSNYDLDIHNNRFSKEWEVALVLDPIKHEGGFFGWSDDVVHPREMLDFYELLEGDSRRTVVAWKNYEAEDPKTGVPAVLNVVNTKNPTGEINDQLLPLPKPNNLSISNLLTNPYAVIGGAALALLLVLSSILLGYYYFFARSNPTETVVNTDAENNNKVLNGKLIQISKDMEGRIAGDKMLLTLKINGISELQVIEDIIRNKGIEILINSVEAGITEETKPFNGAILEVHAEKTLTRDEADAFRNNETQIINMNVEISYNNDRVSRNIDVKYRKGAGDDSAGYEMVFTNLNEKPVPPRQKPETVEAKPTKPAADNPPDVPKPDRPKRPPGPKEPENVTEANLKIGEGIGDDVKNQIQKIQKPPGRVQTPEPKRSNTPKTRGQGVKDPGQ